VSPSEQKTSPRIVSLLSSNTEMLCEIGLAAALVGISHECDYPESILHLPRVTHARVDPTLTSAEIDRQVNDRLREGDSLYVIDEDALLALRPDILLTQAQCDVCAVNIKHVERALERFDADKQPLSLSFQPETLEDVFDDMAQLGRAVDQPEMAEQAIKRLRRRVDAVTVVAQMAESRPRVLVMEWLDPPMPGGCWTPQLVEMAGGRHALGDSTSKTRAREWEEVAASAAEVLIVSPCGFKIDQTLREIDVFLDRAEVRSLPACSDDRVFVADGAALFNRPGPRLVDTLEFLVQATHPQLSANSGIPFPEDLAMPYRH